MYSIYNYQLQKWVDTDNPELVCIDSQGVEIDRAAAECGYTEKGELIGPEGRD